MKKFFETFYGEHKDLLLPFVFGVGLLLLYLMAIHPAFAEPVCTNKSDFPAKLSWDRTVDRRIELKGGLLPSQTASLEFATGNDRDAAGVFELIKTTGNFRTTVSTCRGDMLTTKPFCTAMGKVKITTGPARDGFCKLEPNQRYFFNIRLEDTEGFYFTLQLMHT